VSTMRSSSWRELRDLGLVVRDLKGGMETRV
jgi:hypothetical protein